jgi:hypothetical protein
MKKSNNTNNSNHKGPTHGQATKPCLTCGRPFANRKSWESRGQWEEIKYCSDKCRKNKPKPNA